MVLAIIDQLLLKNGVGEVCAVPGEQVGDPVQNHQGQVGRISLGFLRYFQQLDEVFRKSIRLERNIQIGDVVEVKHPA